MDAFEDILATQRGIRGWLGRRTLARVKASGEQFWVAGREKQARFDGMDLPELRAAAVESLTNAADQLSSSRLTTPQCKHGWTAEEADRLASYFLSLAEGIDTAGPWGQTNMAKWFDSVGITLQAEDDLKTLAYDASSVYNAYIRRKWPHEASRPPNQ